MSSHAFRMIAWRHVHDALLAVPRMFQIWAAKQVTNIAGTNSNQAVYTPDLDPICPSCHAAEETYAHVLFCEQDGRVDAFNQAVRRLDRWLKQNGTDTRLGGCISN